MFGGSFRADGSRSGQELGEFAVICVKTVEFVGKLWRGRACGVIKIAAKPPCVMRGVDAAAGLKARAEAGIAKGASRLVIRTRP
jgi:acetaldehyde dehydrogenase (acetylating)